MLLQDFSGGLNTRVDSRLISPTQATIYENINPINGNIEAFNEDKKEFEAKDKNFINFKDEWVFSDKEFIVYNDTLIRYGEKVEKSKDGKTWYNLGIKEPSNALTLELWEDSMPPIIITQENSTVQNFYPDTELHYIVESYNKSRGTYTYKDIFYTTKDPGPNQFIEKIYFYFPITALHLKIYRYVDREFKAIDGLTDNGNYGETLNKHIILKGDITYAYTYYNINDGSESRFSKLSEITVHSGKVKITGFEHSDDPQVTHIRLYRVGGGLTEFTLVAELDKNVTEFVDDIKNEDLTFETLRDDNLGKCPDNILHMTEYNSMLFAIKDNYLYFSDAGNINAWSPYNFIKFPNKLTGLGVTSNGLLVFTKFKTYIITGNSPSTLSKFLLDGSQGCVDHRSIQHLNGSCIWVSTDGICYSSGGLPQVLSMDVLGKVVINPVSSVIFDRVYYVSEKDKTYFVDMRFNKSIGIINDYYNSLQVYNDELYGIKSDNYVYKLFSSNNKKSLHYKSGSLTEGQISMIKNYKVFYIYAEKVTDMLCNIYIDNKLSISKKLNNKLNEIKIPQSDRLGYYCQIEFIGNGTIKEIEYKVEGRQNGR